MTHVDEIHSYGKQWPLFIMYCIPLMLVAHNEPRYQLTQVYPNFSEIESH